MNKTLISIIIPVLNEAKIIRSSLLKIKEDRDIEIIVVDGGSKDRTVQIAKEIGIKVVDSPSLGRANQMNFGATIASGDIFLFLHIDTVLPVNYQAIIREILSQKNTIAGAFQVKIDDRKPTLRLIEKMVNWRSHYLSLPYGDQAIFLSKSVFQEIGGFPNLPIMEDFELVKRLKRRGTIIIACESVVTSSRRWQKLGIFKTTIINQLIIIGYHLGISAIQLQKLYRHK